MPGALDVLIEIGFEADDSALKEINALLEKESNIIKTVEDRLKALNAERKKPGTNLSDIKAINTEYERTNKVLQQLKGGYREVDYASQAMTRQKAAASGLIDILREAPTFANSFQAGLINVAGKLPAFVNEIQGLQAANAGLVAQGKPVMSVFSSLGATLTKLPNIISLAGIALTVYLEIMDRNARKAEELKQKTDTLTSSISRQSEEVEKMSDRFEHIYVGEDNTVSAAQRKLEMTKAQGVANGEVFKAEKEQYEATQTLRDAEIRQIAGRIQI